MELLKQYGAPKRVAVRVAVEEAEGPAKRGRFAGGGGALPPPRGEAGDGPGRKKKEKEGEGGGLGREAAKHSDEKKKKDEEEEEMDEEEEDEEGLGAVAGLPALPRAAAPPSAARPPPLVADPSLGPSRPPPGYGDAEARAAQRARALAALAREEAAEAAQEHQHQPAVRTVTRAEQLADQAVIQRELAHEVAAPPATLSQTHGGRRKHQLGGMAQEANDNMALYEAQKLLGRQNKKAVRAKYGW